MSNRIARPSGVIDDLICLPVDDVAERVRRGLLVSVGANVLVLFLSVVATNLARIQHTVTVPPPLNLTFEEMKTAALAPEKPKPTPAAPIPKPSPLPPRIAEREKLRPTPPPRVPEKPVKIAEAKPIPKPVPEKRLSPLPSAVPAPAAKTLGTAVPELTVSALTPALGKSSPAAPAAALAGGSASSVKSNVERPEPISGALAGGAPLSPTKVAEVKAASAGNLKQSDAPSAGVRVGATSFGLAAPALDGKVSALSAPTRIGRRGPVMGSSGLATDHSPVLAPSRGEGGRGSGLAASGNGRGTGTGVAGVGAGRARVGALTGGTARVGSGGRGIGTGTGTGIGPGSAAIGNGNGTGLGRGPVQGRSVIAGLGTGTGNDIGDNGDGTPGGAQDGVRGVPVFESLRGRGGGVGRGVGRAGTGPGDPNGNPLGTGNGSPGIAAPLSIVYVLDSSGSMRERNKIGKAKLAIRQALASLGPRDRFNIIHFNNQGYVFARGLIPATAENVAAAGEFVDSIRCYPNTNMSMAMAGALRMQGVTTIFLMSDGEPHGGIDDPEELKDMIRQLNQAHIVIHTLALGLGEDFRGMSLLREIAVENGGRFAKVNLELDPAR